jgi:hypothetical protein
VRETQGSLRWATARVRHVNLAATASLSDYRYGALRLGPYPGGALEAEVAPERPVHARFEVHAEETQVYAVAAPGRSRGASAELVLDAAGRHSALAIDGGAVSLCGPPGFRLLRLDPSRAVLAPDPSPPGGRTRCAAFGDALGVAAVHAQRVADRADLQLEARWIRERVAVAADRDLAGVSVLQGRTIVTARAPAGTIVSGAGECSASAHRSLCSASLSLSRALR